MLVGALTPPGGGYVETITLEYSFYEGSVSTATREATQGCLDDRFVIVLLACVADASVLLTFAWM
jgi:hypothetical protein